MIASADPTLADILAHVIAEPGEPLHRLAYADRCEELGDDERAAFVRSDPALFVLRPRHFWEWFYPGAVQRACPGHPPLTVDRDYAGCGLWKARLRHDSLALTFRRGFAEEVSLSASSWREHGPSLVRSHPLTRVVLTDLIPRRRDTSADGWSIWLLDWDSGGGPLSPWPSFPFLPAGSRSRALAFSDLSDSCLRWARFMARIPCEPVRVPDAISTAQ